MSEVILKKQRNWQLIALLVVVVLIASGAMQRRLQPGHVGVIGICRHFAVCLVLACQAGIVEAVVGLCA